MSSGINQEDRQSSQQPTESRAIIIDALSAPISRKGKMRRGHCTDEQLQKEREVSRLRKKQIGKKRYQRMYRRDANRAR